jgi:porin
MNSPLGRISHFAMLIIGIFLAPFAPAQGQSQNPSVASEEDARYRQEPLDARAQSLWEQDYLTGDWGEFRATLSENHGVTPYLTYIGEVLGNVSGGIRQGAVYEGLVDFGIEIDLERATGGSWQGGTFFANAFQIHGASLTDSYTGDLLVVSSIDALDTIRLFELWFQQNFWEDRISLRAGQLAADAEFAISDYSGLFLNNTFGMPEGIVANAPTPVYAVAALGARLAVKPTENSYLMAGFYDGNPDPADASGNPLNNHGVYWNLGNEGMFAIFEGGYLINQDGPGQAQSDGHDPKAMQPKAMVELPSGLPGTYKIGGWFHTGDFPSNEFDADGVFLGSAFSSGAPRIENGNWGIYAIADQMLWREQPGSNAQGLGAFFRITYSPEEVAFYQIYSDFGITYCGLIPGRDEDTIGIGFAYGGISDPIGSVQAATGAPVQDYTAVLEVTYQFVIAPWWTLQPDFQYVFQPDGASTSSGGLQDAVVLGLRTEIAF